jgi:hypothetical protein
MQIDQNDRVFGYRLYSRRLVIPISIAFNAVPASKVLGSDLPEAITIRAQGETAAADAIDSGGNFSAPQDNNAGSVIFGILASSLGVVNKLLDVDFRNVVGLTSPVVARKGSSSTGVTSLNNIAIEISGTGNLSTTSITGNVTLEYILVK